MSADTVVNAAKFAGDGAVSVFAEPSSQRIVVFVRDRGPGFDPTSMSSERPTQRPTSTKAPE